LVLFGAVYLYVRSELIDHDRQKIIAELDEFANAYNTSGITAFEEVLTAKRKFHQEQPIVVRLAGPANETISLYLPFPWTEFDLRRLKAIPLDETNPWLQVSDIDDQAKLEMAGKRLDDGHWLQVGLSTKDRERVLERLQETFLLVTGPMVLLGFVSGWFLSSRSLKPIRHFVRTVRSVQAGRMNVRVPDRSTGDELDNLAGLFNEMLGTIESLVTGMRQSLDNVAHDLRTPMTRFRMIAENALGNDFSPGRCRDALVQSLEESDRILSLLNGLLDISEAETGSMALNRQTVHLPKFLCSLVDLYRYAAEEKSLQVSIGNIEDIEMNVDPGRISQVLGNILDNAIKYTDAGGQIQIKAFRKKNEIAIIIRDTGCGIAPEHIAHIWERLYRVDRSRSQKGLGIGLCQVKAIASAHGGRVEVVSTPGKGSTFTVFIPSIQ
jgi:signal transduction histidine kinase